MNSGEFPPKWEKGFHKGSTSYTIAFMRYVYARSCRPVRHIEVPKGLLTSRGLAMTETLKAQSFNWVGIDPQEVPSTE
jgi:hypothetical protein